MSLTNFYQPEVLSTINFIPPVFWGRTSLTLMAGSLSFLLAVMWFWFHRVRSKRPLSADLIIGAIFFFWLPLMLVFEYGQYKDFWENWSYPADRTDKEVVRLCNIDQQRHLGGLLCMLNAYMTLAKKSLPAGVTVRLAVAPGIENNFYYNLLDSVRFAKDADYVLIYYPQNLVIKENGIYDKASGKLADDFLKYKPVRIFSPSQAIFIRK